MKIGFDAKRAFFNVSGLGNYSRNLLRALKSYFPDNEYILYTPAKKTSLLDYKDKGFIVKEPGGFFNKTFKSYWRSFSLAKQAGTDRLDIYHGLSHELPYNIQKTGIKTVVTIHDLIFLRFPELYKPVDRKIYRKKFKYACEIADLIIAISKQTSNDIKQFFGIDESRIKVIYQGCNPVFRKELDSAERDEIIKKYGFPESYVLYVGTIEERKNLLSLIKALNTGQIKIPLVVIGNRTGYFKRVNEYIEQNNLKNIYFLETISNDELPAIYQKAEVFVYPSVFEGFGIPVIESLYSKTPVITSKHGCFPEAGGPSSLYVDPKNIGELAEAIKKVTEDSALKQKMIADGYNYAMKFNDDVVAGNIMNAYQNLIKSG
ncbi:MAG: glycosyltransferase family 4 protein [Bacteroidales bacterium]|nr:MAG: glycosyltransferase family 4 protein [Bacteroidales bacterium]